MRPSQVPRRLFLVVSGLCTATAWILITPADLFAWGPATHIAIGEAVLSSLHLLPPAIQAVLRKHRTSFLYGSVAADISFGKKYAAAGRHSHHWHMGEEILETADTEALHAVGLGYLAHLAADTIAHNFFVPRQLLVTSTTQAVGHTYWEHRMDVHLGKRFGGAARRIVLLSDHGEADELFDRVLSRTLFSFQTNRRIFRGMIAFQDHDRWQQVFDEILRRSRFDLPLHTRDRYVRLSYDHVMGYLADPDTARAAGMDPTGEVNLRLAKSVRREAFSTLRRRDPEILWEMADQFFPLPEGPLPFLSRAGELAVPGLDGLRRSASDQEAEPPPPDPLSPSTPS